MIIPKEGQHWQSKKTKSFVIQVLRINGRKVLFRPINFSSSVARISVDTMISINDINTKYILIKDVKK